MPLVLLLLTACSDYGVGPVSSQDDPHAVIAVEPAALSFGELDRDLVASRTFEVSSVGTASVAIETIRIEGSGAFTLWSDHAGRMLAPGDTMEVGVTWTPLSPLDEGRAVVESNARNGRVGVALSGTGLFPDLLVDPELLEFRSWKGEAHEGEVRLASTGEMPVEIEDVAVLGSEFRLDDEAPGSLEPGEEAVLTVTFTPADLGTVEGELWITADTREGRHRVGLTGTWSPDHTDWYVWDDGIEYETTSDPDHVVDYHGDHDLYWYEPSGAHGLLGDADPVSAFGVMREYVMSRAGDPVDVDGPFTFQSGSTLATFEFATFTYILCDFWLDADDDPADFVISSGTVDDGIEVMVNGEILGFLELGESGSFPLSNANPGATNTLIVILVDDSMWERYAYDLAFYEDGVMVE